MKKPQKSGVISKITKGIVPTTAIASGLLSQPSFGAPGDLDPTFGDMGRVGSGLSLKGPAWSIQAPLERLSSQPASTGAMQQECEVAMPRSITRLEHLGGELPQDAPRETGDKP